MDTQGYKVGDIVPYKNTRGNIRLTEITSFEKTDKGRVWFNGVDTVTKAKTWYPVHISKTLNSSIREAYPQNYDREIGYNDCKNELEPVLAKLDASNVKLYEEKQQLKESLKELFYLTKELIDNLDAWDKEYPELYKAQQLLNKREEE